MRVYATVLLVSPGAKVVLPGVVVPFAFHVNVTGPPELPVLTKIAAAYTRSVVTPHVRWENELGLTVTDRPVTCMGAGVANGETDTSGEGTVVAMDGVSKGVESADVVPALPHATIIIAMKQRETIIDKRFNML